MIKTLNDTLSLIALIVVSFLCLRFFVGSLIQNSDTNESTVSRREYLKDYINNEDD